MSYRFLTIALLAAFSCAAGLPPYPAQTQSNDRKFLDDARNSYATLRNQGLVELSVSVDPNWELFLGGVPENRKTTIRNLLGLLHFFAVADSRGKIKVTHQVTGPKPDRATSELYDGVAKGLEKSIEGFIMSWLPFTLTYLIPENLDHFVLQDFGSQYLLTFREIDGDVNLTITKDLELKELRTSDSIIKPSLIRTPQGFLLTGNEASIEDSQKGHIEMKVKLDLAEVQGMKLPQTVLLTGTAGQTPVNLELHFTNYKLKKRF